MMNQTTCQASATDTEQDRARTKLIHHAGGLLVPNGFVTPATLNREVFALFEQHPAMNGLPVVEEHKPIGLINRNIFMQSMARPFHREVYQNKSCIAFMDKEPLVVESALSIQDLSFRVLEGGQKAMNDGFILTEKGDYLGVGTAQDMLRAIANLQAEKNRLLTESIDYASVIQQSLSRPSREEMRVALADHFLIWEPRDTVSGDFYYCQKFEDGFLLVLFDCTGHGVPGAFMTLIMSAFLQSALSSGSQRDPAKLLGMVNRQVKTAMGHVSRSHAARGDGEHRADDGMDAAFCWVDTRQRSMTYAGAQLPLLVLTPEAADVQMIAGDKRGVGYEATPMDFVWSNHQVDLPQGTAVYLFTDGFVDQPGGDKRIAFGKRRTREIILQHRHATMPEQRGELLRAFLQYQGSETRRDDVSACGFRI